MAEQNTNQGRLKVFCDSCGHSWAEYIELPMGLMAVVDHMKAMRCSNCGGRNKELRVGSPSIETENPKQ